MVEIEIIARMKSDFPTKFGIPRQSGLVDELRSTVIFEPKFRNPDALRGIEGYSHLWLIWQFSEAVREDWSPTVRPPRLGGNKRMGVFATRSPFRPNAIGLSSVKLEKIETDGENGRVIYVSGVDLMSGTPIFDIKPYLAYTDSHPQATGGFTESVADRTLNVTIPDELLERIPADSRDALFDILKEDPRPSYQHDEERIYRFDFAGRTVAFMVKERTLTVTDVE